MVTCRCGESFANYYGSAVAVCPKCGRTYLNTAPDMFEPQTIDEMNWTCPSCKKTVPCARGGMLTAKCIYCGAPKPGADSGEAVKQAQAPMPGREEKRSPDKTFSGLLKRFFGK